MTFHELLSKYIWADVGATLLYLYPDEGKNLEGYREAYVELLGITPVESEYAIQIETVAGDEEEDSYENVYMTKVDEPEHYAADFSPWAEVLSMEIGEELFFEYTELGIIVHILFEITYYGYSAADVLAKRAKLDAAMDEVLQEIRE